MASLPPPLRAALDALSEGRQRIDLAGRSAAITATYQARGNSSRALRAADDALAYALARMPATFAATTEALQQFLQASPDLAPRSMLDVGCGPGTASFAAAELMPQIQRYQLIDRNSPFLDLARTLAGTVLAAGTAEVKAHDLDQDQPLPQADLVVAGYVLAELSDASRTHLVKRLWDASGAALLIVEPGTPDGHARLIEARTALLALGAHVAAPCSHAARCPMIGDRWCRFFARVQRSRDHKLLKGGSRPFEDEPYSYLALTRVPSLQRFSHRIVGRPVERKADIALELCGGKGIEALVIPNRNREIFKQVRRLRWGDPILIPIQAPQAVDEA